MLPPAKAQARVCAPELQAHWHADSCEQSPDAISVRSLNDPSGPASTQDRRLPAYADRSAPIIRFAESFFRGSGSAASFARNSAAAVA